MIDPENYNEDSIDLNLTKRDFIDNYYNHFLDLFDSQGERLREMRIKQDLYQVIEIKEMDLHIGINNDLYNLLLDNKWLRENQPELLNWVYENKDFRSQYKTVPDKSEIVVEVQFKEYEIVYYANTKSDEESWPSDNKNSIRTDAWVPFDSAEDKALYYRKATRQDTKEG